MRKQIYILLCCACLSLSGCGYQQPQTNTDNSALYTLPDHKALLNAVSDILYEIGVKDITEIEIISYEESKSRDCIVTLGLICDEKEITASCTYITLIETWSVSGIHNAETNYYYWLPEGMDGLCDLYDFQTDTIISAKSDDFSLDEVLEKNDEKTQEATDEFDSFIEELETEYGLD